jgi:hypothetical protein
MKAFDLAIHRGQDTACFELAKDTMRGDPGDLLLRYRGQSTMCGQTLQQ